MKDLFDRPGQKREPVDVEDLQDLQESKQAAFSQCRWDNHRDVRCPIAPEVLNQVCKQPLGSVGGCTVWLVDGPLVRDLIDIDFTQGGNFEVYGYVPLKEIWLEDKDSAEDLSSTLLHELVEAYLMNPDSNGLPYDTSHDLASGVEDRTRGSARPRTKDEILPWVQEQFGFWLEGQKEVVDRVKEKTAFAALLKVAAPHQVIVRVKGSPDVVDSPKKPDKVWTIIRVKNPKVPFTPIPNVTAFFEDEVHDWKWSNGKLRYFSRILSENQPSWLLLEFGLGAEKKCPKCGKDYPSNANFCPDCGVKLEPKTASSSMRRLATKTRTEKEDEETERLIHKTPSKKPPRHDLRRETVEPDRAPIEVEDGVNRDEYKRVASRWLVKLALAGKTPPKNTPKSQKRQEKKHKFPKLPALKTPTSEKKKESEHRPGEVWKSDQGNWIAKNPDGVAHDFRDNRENAEAYAKGKEVELAPEKGKATSPEPEGEKKPEADGRRDVTKEKEFDGSDEWVQEHQAKTPGGSSVLGTPHMGEDENSDKFIKEKIVPSAVSAAEEAIKAGKKVVFLAEGQIGGFEDSEQALVSKALKDKYGDKVEQDTWDPEGEAYSPEWDDEVGKDRINPESKAVKELAKQFGGDTDAVVAALYAFDVGQPGGADILLTPEVEKTLKSWGIDPSNQRAMYLAAFPHDAESDEDKALLKGMKKNPVAKIQDTLNKSRQDRMVKRIQEIEAAGGVAIVTPGASHAYELKDVLEKGSPEKKTDASPPDAEAKKPADKGETPQVSPVESWVKGHRDPEGFRKQMGALGEAFKKGSPLSALPADTAVEGNAAVQGLLDSQKIPKGTFKTVGEIQSFLSNKEIQRQVGKISLSKDLSKSLRSVKNKKNLRVENMGAEERQKLQDAYDQVMQDRAALKKPDGTYDKKKLDEYGAAYELLHGSASKKKKKDEDEDDWYGGGYRRFDIDSSNPSELGRALAMAEIAGAELTDPLGALGLGKDPEGIKKELGKTLSPKDQQEMGLKTSRHFQAMTPKLREEAAARVNELLREAGEGTEQQKNLQAVVNGLALAATMYGESLEVDGKFLRPEASPQMSVLARKLAKRGEEEILLDSMDALNRSENRKKLQGVLDRLDGKDIEDILGGSKGPYGDMLKDVDWDRDGSPGEEEAKKMLRRLAVNEMTNFQAVLFAVASGKTEEQALEEEYKLRDLPGSVVSRTIKTLRAKFKPVKTQKAQSAFRECLDREMKSGKSEREARKSCAHLRDEVMKAHAQDQIDTVQSSGKKLDPGDPVHRQLLDTAKEGEKAQGTEYVPPGDTHVGP